MKLEQQVISLELAKRLKELRVKQEAIWHWVEVMNADFYQNTGSHFELHQNHGVGRDSFAAFTVAELGEMLPEGIMSIRPLQENEWEFKSEEKWFVADAADTERKYLCMNNWFIDTQLSSEQKAATEAEARGLMLAYLIENNLMSL